MQMLIMMFAVIACALFVAKGVQMIVRPREHLFSAGWLQSWRTPKGEPLDLRMRIAGMILVVGASSIGRVVILGVLAGLRAR